MVVLSIDEVEFGFEGVLDFLGKLEGLKLGDLLGWLATEEGIDGTEGSSNIKGKFLQWERILIE